MDRHPALQDLSRDHYQILVLCTHVERALEGEPPVTDPEEAAADLARAWAGDLPAHLREEETVLLPALAWEGSVLEVEPVPLVHDDHPWLRDRLDALVDAVADDEPAAEVAGGIVGRLRRHVELEERTLFPNVEAILSEDQLGDLAEASRSFREDRRGPASVGPRKA